MGKKKMGVMLRLGAGVVVAGVALSLTGQGSGRQEQRDEAEIYGEVAAAIEAGRPDVVAVLTSDKGVLHVAKKVALALDKETRRAAKKVARKEKVARGIARRAQLDAEQKKVAKENKAPRKGPPKFYEVRLNPEDRRIKFYEVRS